VLIRFVSKDLCLPRSMQAHNVVRWIDEGLCPKRAINLLATSTTSSLSASFDMIAEKAVLESKHEGSLEDARPGMICDLGDVYCN